MTHNNYIYIAVMALVSYAIRILPLTLIRKPIKNRFIQSFLYYVPYVTLAVMTSGHHSGNAKPGSRCCCTGSWYCRRMVWRKPVSGGCRLLCRGVRAGIFYLMPYCGRTK